MTAPSAKAVAVIPARGGSKRITRKNIKEFHGKPMIAYSIEAALSCGLFDRVIVSTDDDEIAKTANDYGAETPFLRPESLADDFATTSDVMQHALLTLSENGQSFDYACCLYATAPFLRVQALKDAYAILVKSDCKYCFSATSYGFPIQRAIKHNDDGGIEMFSPEFAKTRSQDLEPAFHDAGQFYWGLTSAFEQQLPIFAPHSRMVILPKHEVVDIDTPEDWLLAERLFALHNP